MKITKRKALIFLLTIIFAISTFQIISNALSPDDGSLSLGDSGYSDQLDGDTPLGLSSQDEEDEDATLGLSAALLMSTYIEMDPDQTLIFGPDNKYILQTDNGALDPLPATAWATPTGTYDPTTIILGPVGTAYIRTEVPAVMRAFAGEETELHILEGSDISFSSDEDITAITVKRLNLGSDSPVNPTAVTNVLAKSNGAGIRFFSGIVIGDNADLKVEANTFGIAYAKDEENTQWDDIIYAYKNAKLDITVTGVDAVGIQAYMIQLDAADSVKVNATNGKYGIHLNEGLYIGPGQYENIRTTVDVYSHHGRAIQTNTVSVYGVSGYIKSTAEFGEFGINASSSLHVDNYSLTTADRFLIEGRAQKGFGVASQSVDADYDFPSGSISINDANLIGYVEEGMGISTNLFTVTSSDKSTFVSSAKGTADLGIGISICMLSADNSVIEGISNGSTENHYQVYDSIPDSAGINVLSYFNAYGETTMKGIAPKNEEGSYGIRVFLPHYYEGMEEYPEPFGSGSMHFAGTGVTGEKLLVTAEGETGLFSPYLMINSADATFNITGGKDGIYVGDFMSSSAEDTITVNAIGETGTGVVVGKFHDHGVMQVDNIELNATGAIYGLEISVFPQEHNNYIINSVVDLKTTGNSSTAAGYFHVNPYASDYMGTNDMLNMDIANSSLIGESFATGLLFEDTIISISTFNNSPTINIDPLIKGIGNESGILFEFSDDFIDDITSGNKKVITTDPNLAPLTVHGISTGVPVDKVGRKAAFSSPNFSIDDNTTLIEEYIIPSEQIIVTEPLFIYADKMNIADNSNYFWSTPNNKTIDASAIGLSSADSGAYKEQIIGERTAPISGESYELTSGIHRIIMASDINIYTVTFDANGGNPTPIDQQIPTGSPVNDPGNDPVMVDNLGHHILYWEEVSSGNPWSFGTDLMPLKDIQLRAVWEANNYNVTFHGNGNDGGSMPSQPFLYGQVNSLDPNAFIKTDYSFMGWDTDISGTNVDFQDGEVLDYLFTNDIDLYAVWAANPTIKVEYYKQHPTTGNLSAIGSWPADVKGLPGDAHQTMGLTDTNYHLVAVEEWAYGAANGISKPLADYALIFPDYEHTTTIKYIYKELVEVTLFKNLDETTGLIDSAAETFDFKVWGVDKTEPPTATHSVVVHDAPSAPNGSVILSGLFAGGDYYVKEIISNPSASSYYLDSFDGTTYDATMDAYLFTAPDTAIPNAKIAANNKYNLTDIRIIKHILNNEGKSIDYGDSFKVRIVNTEHGYDVEKTVTSEASTDFTGLVVGKTYTIQEVTPLPAGYENDNITSDNISLTDNGTEVYEFIAPNSDASITDAVIHVRNNVVYNNNITIQKAMASGQQLLETSDSFDFFLWREGETEPSTPNITGVTSAPVSLTSFSGVTLIEGHTYYLKEAAKTGYLHAEFSDGMVSTPSNLFAFTVPADNNPLTITATNKLNIIDGSVAITKELSNGAPYNSTDQFKITVGRVLDDGTVVEEVEHSITVDQTITLDGLVAGKTYRVTETGMPTGYIFKSIDNSEINKYDFTAPSTGGSVSKSIVVTNSKDVGEVIIRKNYGTSTALRDNDVFTFKVWDQSENYSTAVTKTINMSSSDNTPIKGLVGSVDYYISEDSVSSKGYKLVEVRDNDSIVTPVNVSGVNAYPFTAPTTFSGTLTLTFSNERDLLDSNAIGTAKELSTGDVLLSSTDSFTLNVQRVDSNNQPTSDNAIKVIVKPASDGTVGATVAISGLVAGEKYLIKEGTPLPSGYEFVSITADNGLTLTETSSGSGQYTFTAPANSTVAGSYIVTLENKHKVIPAGKLTLIKEMISGQNPLNSSDMFDFYLWRDGETKPTTANISGTALNTTVNLPALIAGQKYYLEEENYTAYDLDKIVSSTNISLTHENGNLYSFIAPSSAPASTIAITATNKRASVNAVSLSKVATTPLNAADSFEFKVWRDGDASTTAVTVTAHANAGTVSINNLVPGEDYFIEETAKTGYKLTDITGSSVTLVSGNRYKFTAPLTATTPLALTANNNLKLVDGKVSLTKETVSGTLLNASDDQFEFTIWRSGTAKPTAITHTVVANGTAIAVDSLVEGQKYYIEENSKSGYVLDKMTIAGKELSKDSTGYYFTVPTSAGAPIAISVINDYAYMKQVSINKQIAASGGALNENDTFTVKIWDSSLTQASAKTYTLKAGENPQAVSDLIAGQTYHIVEEMPVGYKLKNISINGVLLAETAQGSNVYAFTAPVDQNTPVAISLTNDYNYLPDGSAELLNSMITGESPINPDDAFDFTVWRSGTTKPSNPNYKANVDGNSIPLAGIIAGQKYYVQQSEHVGYLLDDINLNGTTLSKDSTGYYFIAPVNGASTATINAVNRIHYLANDTLSLEKKMKSGETPINTTDSFSVNIALNGNNPDSYSLVIDGAKVPATGLIAGQKYYISEDSATFYRLLGFNSSTLAIGKDADGDYFVAPSSDSVKHTITVTNELDVIPDGRVKLAKEMDANEDGDIERPFSPKDEFKFFVWRDGTTRPSRSTHSLIIGHRSPVEINQLIGGFKYYIAEENKTGYINRGFILNGVTLSKDSGGYYFYAPTSTSEDEILIEAINALDNLPDGTILLETVTIQGKNTINLSGHVSVTVRAKEASLNSFSANVRSMLNGERVPIGEIVAGKYYYVLDDDILGYTISRVLLNGVEVERDELGFFFRAPERGFLSVITVEYVLEEANSDVIDVTKYINNKTGGTDKLEEETFEVILKNGEFEVTGKISSKTGEFTWDDDEAVLPLGTYTVTEVLQKDSAFTQDKILITVNGEKIEDGSPFELTDEIEEVSISVYNKAKGLLPSAGGFPVQLLVLAIGVVLIIVGIILKKRSSDKK